MAPGTTHFRSKLRYANANPHGLVGTAPLFPGFAPGLDNYSNYSIYFNDFLRTADYDSTNDWTATTVGAGTTVALSDDTVPGHLTFTSDAAENDGAQVQFTGAGGAGEVYLPAAGRNIYFETRFRLRDANNDIDTVEQVDIFLGLAVTDTTVIAGATDFIGFSKVDGSGALKFVMADAGGAAGVLQDGLVGNTIDTLVAADANTWIKLGFLLEGTSTVYVYYNDVHVQTITTNVSTQVPDTECCVTLAMLSGEGVAKIMDVDYVLVAQTR